MLRWCELCWGQVVYLLQQQGQELNELVGWQHLHIGLLEAAQLLFFGLNRGRRFQSDIQTVKRGLCGPGSYLGPSLTESNAGVRHCCVIPKIQSSKVHYKNETKYIIHSMLWCSTPYYNVTHHVVLHYAVLITARMCLPTHWGLTGGIPGVNIQAFQSTLFRMSTWDTEQRIWLETNWSAVCWE